MAEKTKQKPSRSPGKFDVFIKILTGMKPEDLHPYQKFNVVMTMITALTILVLIVPPVLSLVNSILVSVLNFIVAILKQPLLTVPAGASVSEWTYLACIAILVVEFIVCHLFCLRAAKENSEPPPENRP